MCKALKKYKQEAITKITDMTEIMGPSVLVLLNKFKSVASPFHFATYKQMAVHQRLQLFSTTKHNIQLIILYD
jgi:hypothetical protein